MSENNAVETTTTEVKPGVESTDGGSYQPPASQADLDRIISERLGRERAKFADYEDLRSKASKLDELEKANQSDLEKLTERLTAAEKLAAERAEELSKTELKALKSDVAREKGVPVGHLTGTTKEELEASADELVKWRDANAPAPKKPLRSGYVREASVVNPRERAVAALRAGVV
ncbi:hypothetical protein ACH47B_13325 [Rhodococcus sp. NPDC019627]|uniref:hypothetical protein n=1 Tax=unclassified Rhodococcus (in: high G+C Gram-positive bacteria) TaxID=192944 RepID=UPI0033C4099A